MYQHVAYPKVLTDDHGGSHKRIRIKEKRTETEFANK